MAVARGAVPIPAEELLHLRVFLAEGGEGDAAAACREALLDQAAAEIVPLIADQACPPEVLGFLLRERGEDEALVEAVLTHPQTSDASVAEAARTLPAPLLERVVEDQVRMLRCEELVEVLETRDDLPPMAKVRLEDVRQEYARRARRREGRTRPAPAAPPPVAEDAAEGEAAAAAEGEAGTADALPEDGEAEEGGEGGAAEPEPEISEEAIIRIMRLSIPERIQMAMKGNREERAILIRDKVKSVSLAVLKSPKITDGEVEMIAGMRNVVEEVIREIALSREWTGAYGVILALCRNPKSPARQVLTFMGRLNTRDLKLLAADRAVTEIVRTNARRFYAARTEQKKRPVKRR
jgi:hypothetical protein